MLEEGDVIGLRYIVISANTSPTMRVSEHQVRFVAGGRTVWIAYSEGGVLETPVPDVPKVKGQVGCWKETELGDRDAVVEAVYRPVKVTYTQYDGSSETRDWNEPAPEPLGYDGCEASWEPFKIGSSDIEVKARYRGPRFFIRYMADGKEVATEECGEGEFPSLPPVPEKRGHRGRWPAVVPCAERIKVHAEYSPLTMEFVTGIGRSEIMDYGPDWKERAPAVPLRKGFAGEWAASQGDGGVLVMKPVYLRNDAEDSGGPEAMRLDRSLVEKALDDLAYVSEAWYSAQEDPSLPAYTINDAPHTEDAVGWEGFVRSLGAVEKGYLESCFIGRAESEEYLSRQGLLRLAIESAINAAAEDCLGDPIVLNGVLDRDCEDDLREMLNNGS